jgi:hypothetical protein
MSERVEPLSEPARLQRIGEILCDAIFASGFADDLGGEQVDPAKPSMSLEWDRPSTELEETEKRVIRHLGRVGEASPSSLRTVLRMPRTTAYRVMNRLVELGQIVSEGQTRSLVYRLGVLPPHNQNVEGN